MTTRTRHARKEAAHTRDWRADALCAQVDAELFFPNGNGIITARQTQAAKSVCQPCPARQHCLEWALSTGQHTGVWGGLSEQERRGLSKVRESTMTLCMNRQPWIEEQLAAGVSQKQIAQELGVDRGVLSRAIQRFGAERTAAGEQVTA